MKKNSRIVIDTNVLISALVFGGTPRKVTDLVGTGTVTPILSEEMMSEMRRIIRAKFPAFLVHSQQLEKLLQRYSLWVKLGSIDVHISRDPDDNKVLETAVIGKCDYIVSGDKDLLDIHTYQDIQIVSPGEFLRLKERD